jgi:phosphoribosylformylglycinamidine (FGAM) synthase-like enzyme
MLMVLRPEKEAEARAVFDKWDLDFAIVGQTIAEDRFVIVHGNETVADLPLSKLSSEAPEYDRPWVESPPAPELDPGGRGRPGRRAQDAHRLTELLFARLDL